MKKANALLMFLRSSVLYTVFRITKHFKHKFIPPNEFLAAIANCIIFLMKDKIGYLRDVPFDGSVLFMEPIT